MKYKINLNPVLALAFLALVGFFFSCETDESPKENFMFNNLVFADEFDVDGAPNSQYWTYDIGGWGWGNAEWQYYTDRPSNVVVRDGHLVITARQEQYEGNNYTSARLKTQGLFEQAYGRYEARIRFPYGQGLWPAFWMLGNDIGTVGWPQCGEIDIFEYVIGNPSGATMAGTLHGPGYSAGASIGGEYESEDSRFDTDFHVFGVEWTEEYINFYVDGTVYNQLTPDDVTGEWVFDHPFFLLLNLAVGGFGQPGPDDVMFPQTMLVDYVRVYN